MSFYDFIDDNYDTMLSIDLGAYEDMLTNTNLVFFNYRRISIVEKENCPTTFYSDYILNQSQKIPFETPIDMPVFPQGNLLSYIFLHDITEDEIMQNDTYRELLGRWLNIYKNSFCIVMIRDFKLNFYVRRSDIYSFFYDGICRSRYGNYLLDKFMSYSHFYNKKQDILHTVKNIESNVVKYDTPQLNVDNVELKNARLYNYQITDVNFMKTIEENIINKNNNIHGTYKNFMDFKIGGVKYSKINNEIFLHNDCNVFYEEINEVYHGGIIHNEPGLGKTLSMLYYIFSQPNERSENIEYSDNCDYFYKRGKMNGLFCDKVKIMDTSYCNTHKNATFVEKVNYKLIDENIDIDYTSNATLVVCPSHLCDQWMREVSKFKNMKNIIMITTYEQFKHLTYQDLYYADLIVVSYQMFVNQNYVKTSDKKIQRMHYKRIIFDEINELPKIINGDKIFYKISNLKCDFKWCLTGTPFDNVSQNVLMFISLMTSSEYTSLSTNLSHLCTTKLNTVEATIKQMSKIFHKHTKESVSKELSKNVITTTHRKLTFTRQEREIYDSMLLHKSKFINQNALIKLCCHTELFNEINGLVKSCKTLDEIQQVIHDKNKKDLENTTIKISELKYEIEYHSTMLEDANRTELEIATIKNNISNFKREITLKTKYIESLQSVINYLDNVVNNISEDETCPICLDNIDEVTITKCGHLFCWDCINESMTMKLDRDEILKCPTCNQHIRQYDIFKVDKHTEGVGCVEFIEGTPAYDINKYINDTKSTKIGNIVYYLLHELKENDKCIVFSQWDYILDKIGGIIGKYIKVANCKGSVYQKKRAVQEFSKDINTKVILLSSKNCASGLNLIEANKILFIEPVYGTTEHRNGIEMQAISRADRITQRRDIEVVRFYIGNTIEEEVYNIN